jgi:hypothetical protein
MVPIIRLWARWAARPLLSEERIDLTTGGTALTGYPAAVDARLEKSQIVFAGSFTWSVDIKAREVIHTDCGPFEAISISFV